MLCYCLHNRSDHDLLMETVAGNYIGIKQASIYVDFLLNFLMIKHLTVNSVHCLQHVAFSITLVLALQSSWGSWGGVYNPPLVSRATCGICAKPMRKFIFWWVAPALPKYTQTWSSTKLLLLSVNIFMNQWQFLARDVIYTSRRLCYDVSARLSVMEVHWCIIANLGIKFRSQFTAHCGHGACGHEHWTIYSSVGTREGIITGKSGGIISCYARLLLVITGISSCIQKLSLGFHCNVLYTAGSNISK